MAQRGKVVRKGPADAHRALGTTVSVRDFFYNMPVRRKQMSSGYELERIKQTLERIALVHPQVRFYLYDTTKGSTILHTRQVRPYCRTIANSCANPVGLSFVLCGPASSSSSDR